MRGLAAGVLAVTACASSDLAPDAAPDPADAAIPDAYVPPDAPPPPDGEPVGPGTFLHDLPADFTGSTAESTVVTAWGSVEPVAYFTGGLRMRASDTGVFGSAATATWADVANMPVTGVAAAALSVDRAWAAAAPAGVGLTGGDYFTLMLEGEILLDAGGWQFHLLVDDHGFVELAPPGSTSFTRVASADWAAEGSGGYTATTTGWHPIRIALAEQEGNVEWHLQATPPAAARGPISRHRLRFRADSVAGLVQTATDDAYLLGSADTTIDDDQPANRDWGSGAPDDLGLLDADYFTVRWAGQVRIDDPGSYGFRLVTDDGQRLWIDGQPLLSAWDETTHDSVSSPIALDAGWHEVVVDHMEIAGGARATLTVESGPAWVGSPLPVDHLRPVVGRRERHDGGADRADRAIPDLGSVDALVAVDAPAGAKVRAVEVSFGFTHSYHNDLQIRLIAPDSTTVLLRDYDESPTGSGARGERLLVTDAALTNVNAAGTWRLRVSDTVSIDSGTLQDFQITVHHGGGQPPVPASAAYESPAIDLGAGITGWTSLTWGARAVAGSGIALRARAAAGEAELATAAWSTPMVDPGGSVPPMPPARWFQYRIELTSDGDASPAVDWVRLDYATEGP